LSAANFIRASRATVPRRTYRAAPRRLTSPGSEATGRHPRLAQLLAPASSAQVSPAEQAAAEPADRYRDILARILSGLLGPEIADISRRSGPVTSGER
jgi:hypothetical protein